VISVPVQEVEAGIELLKALPEDVAPSSRVTRFFDLLLPATCVN
jgi:hypothetical protein